MQFLAENVQQSRRCKSESVGENDLNSFQNVTSRLNLD